MFASVKARVVHVAGRAFFAEGLSLRYLQSFMSVLVSALCLCSSFAGCSGVRDAVKARLSGCAPCVSCCSCTTGPEFKGIFRELFPYESGFVGVNPRSIVLNHLH